MSTVQAQMPPQLPPNSSLITKLRQNLFASPLDCVVTCTCAAFFAFIIYFVIDWAFVSSVWSTEDEPLCKQTSGACWSVIDARHRIIFFGLFPYEEHWRSTLACIVMIATIVLSCIPWFWSAMGRRSKLPVIARLFGLFIDFFRSLPLLTILFTAAVITPFILPGWLQGDKLYRVIAGFAIFFACYQAENIRAGLQAIPSGQDEAGLTLGLSYWQRVTRVQLPQAFRNSLPAIVNQFVITFKETSIVTIVGFFEILASGAAAYGTGEWTVHYIEVYVFIGAIYFIFVFSLSRYGAYLEKKLRVGHD